MGEKFRFIDKSGAEKGLSSVTDIASAIEGGELTESSLIRDAAGGLWTRADERPEFVALRNLALGLHQRSGDSPTAAENNKSSIPEMHAAVSNALAPSTLSEEPFPEVQPPLAGETRHFAVDIKASEKAYGAGRRWMFGVFASGLLIVSGIVPELWLAHKLNELILIYGYGSVPPSLLPQNLDWIDNYYYATSVIGWLGVYVCTFSAMYRARKVHELLGVTGYTFTFFWTAATMFVPIACLFRPWLGLAEIRRVAIVGARTGTSADAWNSNRQISWATVCLAIFVFLAGGILRGIGKELPDLEKTAAGDFSRVLVDYANTYQINILIVVLFTLYLGWYIYGTLKSTYIFLGLGLAAPAAASAPILAGPPAAPAPSYALSDRERQERALGISWGGLSSSPPDRN